jgi:hypothetical protein
LTSHNFGRPSSSKAKNLNLSEAWSKIPENLTFYDYIGNNPTKGGLFRVGAMDNGDGIIVGWLSHGVFRDKEGHELFVHCMPTFFETFLVVLVDEKGIVRVVHVEYETSLQHYAHIDCPSHIDYLRNMIIGGRELNCQFDSWPFFFCHNLCYRCPNGPCKPIFDIYTLLAFQ